MESFARTLEKQGWTVWWDRHIPTGQTYDSVIWSALQAASCVVVVWSSHSISKEWVKEEAGAAKKRNILFPVRIDEVEPPFGFGLRQAQSLVGWQAGVSHPGYDQFLKDIADVLKKPRSIGDPSRSATLARLRSYLWLILPTLLVAALAGSLMMLRVSTHVQIELTVGRVEFAVGKVEGGWKNLFGPLDVEEVIFSRFSQVSMSPKSVEVADPKQYNADDNTFPDRAWLRVAFTQDSLQFVAGEAALHPTVTVQAELPKAPGEQPRIARADRLDAVSVVGGSTIILNRGGGAGASATAEVLAEKSEKPEKPKAILTPTSIYRVMPHNTMVHGATAAAFPDADGFTYRVSPKAGSTVTVEGEPNALAMTIRPVGDAAEALNGADSIPITAINLFRQNNVGEQVSTLSKKQEAVIRYPEYGDLTAVKFVYPDLLAVEELDRFVIERIEWSTKAPGIRLILDGIAGHIATKSGDFIRDHRVTRYDQLIRNTKLMAVLAVMGWFVPTLIGARKLLKELR